MLQNPLIKNSCSDWLRILRKQMYALNRPWFEQTRHQIFINQLNLEKIFNMLINFIKKKNQERSYSLDIAVIIMWHFSTSVHTELSNVRINLGNWKVNNYLRFSHSYLHHGMMSQACQSVCVTVLFFSPTFNINFQLGSQKYRQHCNINTDWNLDAQIFQDCYSLLRQMKNTWLDGQMNAHCRSAQIKHIKYKSLYSYYIPH